MSTQQSSASTFRRLLGYLKHYRLGFLVAILGMIGYASVDVFFLSQFDQFIDRGITERDMSYIWPWRHLWLFCCLSCGAFFILLPPIA